MDIEGTTMSLWDWVGPKGIGKIAKQPFDVARHLITGQSDSDRRKQQEMMNQQIKDYQEQSKLAKDELSRAKDQQVAEKRRIQEKQIRSLRGRSSSRGFLGSSSGMESGLTSKLGG